MAAKQPNQLKSTSIHTSCGTFARHGLAKRVQSLHIPPPTQPSKEQDNNNSKEHNQRSRSNRGRGKGRGPGRGPPEGPQKLYCHFHGVDASHRTNQCPEKKKTPERMEVEKKAKLVGHTSWPIQQAQQFQTTQPTFNPPF